MYRFFKFVEKFDIIESAKPLKFNGKSGTLDVQIFHICKKELDS